MLFAATSVEQTNAPKLNKQEACGPTNGCGCNSAPAIIEDKSDAKGAAAVRTAEKSVKNVIKKLEEKIEKKSDQKDAVNAIEKVKKEQEEA